MSSNVKDVLQAPIIRCDSIDSTNNYAAQLADAETAQEGLTIVAQNQTAGKGQRGNTWQDQPGQALLMSILLYPQLPLEQQFLFSAAIAVAVVDALQSLDKDLQVAIKFPNDIIINDKKAAGILIENALRGSTWAHAIVGLGLNVFQRSFSEQLPHATSLILQSHKNWDIDSLMHAVRAHIAQRHTGNALARYNQLLYRRGQHNYFEKEGNIFDAQVIGVNPEGQLLLSLADGSTQALAHGSFTWIW